MVGALLRVQTANAQRAGGDHMLRMMHAKTIVGMVNASLAIDQALPAELAVGHFSRAPLLPVILRLSNASGVPQTDAAPDLRGLALRISLPRRGRHDLLLANFPTSVARDAGQFFEIAKAGLDERETFLARLADRLGLRECQRIAADLKASLRLCASPRRRTLLQRQRLSVGRKSGSLRLAADGSPIRLRTRPAISADMLRCELAARLAATDVRYRAGRASLCGRRAHPDRGCREGLGAADLAVRRDRHADHSQAGYPRSERAGRASPSRPAGVRSLERASRVSARWAASIACAGSPIVRARGNGWPAIDNSDAAICAGAISGDAAQHRARLERADHLATSSIPAPGRGGIERPGIVAGIDRSIIMLDSPRHSCRSA